MTSIVEDIKHRRKRNLKEHTEKILLIFLTNRGILVSEVLQILFNLTRNFQSANKRKEAWRCHNFFCVCFIRVSTEARDLISAMLNINPLTRPTLKQIRRHPWMTMKGDMASTIVRIHSLAKTMWPANEIRPTSPVLAPVVKRIDICSILID